MTSYAPVPVLGSVVQGPQEQSPERDRLNGTGGVRTEWWWQAGPVDSCCCCCSLGLGVALMALDCLVSGLWVLFFSRAFYASTFESSLVMLQKEYARNCGGAAASTLECEQIMEGMEQTEGALNVFRHFPTVVYVQGFLSIVAGVLGLWAVFFKSKQAAKLYMLSWPARCVLMVWGALEFHSLDMKYDVDNGYSGIIYFLTFILLLYYYKVSWSYYKRRAEFTYDAPSSGRSASSDAAYRAAPMVAMNTNV